MSHPHRWAIARLLLTTHLPFLVAIWVVVALLVAAITGGFAVFAEVKSSKWDESGSVLRWFALGYGAHLTHRLLPTYIAHGQTRRAFMREVTVFMAISAAVVGALMSVGYALEGLLYRGTGWPQRISPDRLFDSPDQWLRIFLAYWALLLIWAIAGALLGAGFYRSNELGAATIVASLVLVGLTAVAVGFAGLPFRLRLPGLANLPLGVSLAMCAAIVLLGIGATWTVVRDLPVGTKFS
jgi:hypothetical protein